MTNLSTIRDALRQAHKTLPRNNEITDLAYLLDVDPYGAESLVVYVTARAASSLDFLTKRAMEAKLRRAVGEVSSYTVYFRWQTDEEASEESPLETKSGLLDVPRSALREAS